MTAHPRWYQLDVTDEETGILLATCHQQYVAALRMARLFNQAARNEGHPPLANFAEAWAHEAVMWQRIGCQLEAMNPSLQPETWRPDQDQLDDFMGALEAIGFRLTTGDDATP